jgi:hypothetical protein
MTVADDNLFDAGWEDLLNNRLYADYVPPARIQSWLERFRSQPGNYVVEAPPHYGKTALMRHLWESFANRIDWKVTGYVFQQGRRTEVRHAIRQINRQLKLMGLIRPDADERRVPWSLVDKKVAEGEDRLMILIDALDESDHVQWCELDHLLPTLPLRATALIVTTRLPISEYGARCAAVLQDAGVFHLDRLELGDITSLLRAYRRRDIEESSTSQIWEATEGHPAAVAASNPPDPASQISKATEGHPGRVAAIARSGDPERILARPLASLEDLQAIARRDLEDMERRAVADRALLRRLQALLAIAPADLSLVELHEILELPDPEHLRRLCDRLGRHIQTGSRYQIRSPDVREYILEDARQGGIYCRPVDAMRAAVARWYRQQYEQTRERELRHLPRHVLRHAPSFLLDAPAPEMFVGERIFTDRRWIQALDDGFDTFADLYDAVQTAWREAERLAQDSARILGVTTCALVLTSLQPAFPPEAVADLVRRGLVTRQQAERYASTYRSQRERDELERWLGQGDDVPEHLFHLDFEAIARSSRAEHSRRLHDLHRRWLRPGSEKLKILLETLRAEQFSSQPAPADVADDGGPALPELIEQLEAGLPDAVQRSTEIPVPVEQTGTSVGMRAPYQLDLDVLSEIAARWTPDEPRRVDYYLRLTRLFDGSTRDLYCDALITLTPTIKRVFGAAYLEKLITIIEAIRRAYP